MGYLDSLNPEQANAASHTEGPLLILAGAGSGKTRVLVHRIAYLIDNEGVSPWNILAITFTNKAAGEMRQRVDDMIGNGADSIFVSTFHSMCVRILRRHADRIGYDTNFTIYDTDDQKTVMKDVMKRLDIDTKQVKERAVLNAISSAKDSLIDPDEYATNSRGDYRGERIAKLYAEYQNTLKRSNAMDFDDLIVNTIKLFKQCPEVLNNYQERFRYIMVDEYQDTNEAQFELVSLLAAKYRNLCVVGDDDQSIYKFRGANIGNILDFEKTYEDAKVVKLEQNYRSTQTILDAANAVIKNNTARKDKSLWSDRGEGARIHYRTFENAFEEAEYIASEVAKGMKKGEIQSGECAVLYRTNAQSRILEEAFVREGLPYDVVGGVNFYARKEIKDLMAYLKTIDNAVDDVAVKRIINIPKRGIGQTTINKIADYATRNNISFYDALTISDSIEGISKATALKIDGFTNMIRVHRGRLESINLVKLLENIIEETGYVRELEESEEEDAQDRIGNIDELISTVAAYEEKTDEPTLSGFLEEAALISDIDRVDDADKRVLLMTMHAAKGLEFGKVFISGAEDGIFPSGQALSSDDPTDIEEERRLAYVAITRAKDDLTISHAKMRMNRGNMEYNPVSRFVREIPENLMDNKPEKPRRREFDDYDDDSYERTTFRSKPFGGSFGDSFSGYGGSYGASGNQSFGREFDNSYSARPRAIVGKKSTPEINKPYIAKGIGSLGAAGISKGLQNTASLDYAVGDRVSHIKYGIGTVLEIVSEVRDYKVTVDFERAGKKIMYAGFAKLKKVDCE